MCNAGGTSYGACVCSSDDGSTVLCVPGQSIACTGPGGCFSSQVCNGDGTGYEPCVCVGDGGSVECQTAADCENLLGPLAPVCMNTCPDAGGVMECLHYLCVLGVCQTTYCG